MLSGFNYLLKYHVGPTNWDKWGKRVHLAWMWKYGRIKEQVKNSHHHYNRSTLIENGKVHDNKATNACCPGNRMCIRMVS